MDCSGIQHPSRGEVCKVRCLSLPEHLEHGYRSYGL